MFQEIECPLALRLLETRLQRQHVTHGRGKAPRDGYSRLMPTREFVRGQRDRLRFRHFFLGTPPLRQPQYGFPEKHAEQKHRCHGFALRNACIGTDERCPQELTEGLIAIELVARFREQLIEEPILPEEFERAL